MPSLRAAPGQHERQCVSVRTYRAVEPLDIGVFAGACPAECIQTRCIIPAHSAGCSRSFFPSRYRNESPAAGLAKQ